jgi:glycosyltransferase involved in cell wall biosynthesis
MRSTKSICLLSCLVSVKDSHTRHFLRVLARYGYETLSIRPGSLDIELLAQGVRHRELPEVTYHFWPEGTPLPEIIKALSQRTGNALRAMWQLMQERPHVVMCMEPDSWLLALLLKPLLRHRVVADLRELYEDRLLAFPKVLQPLLRPLFRGTMWLMSLGTDEIMHVSEERRGEYRWLGKPGVVVVYYPDPLVFAKAKAARAIVAAGLYRPTRWAPCATAMRPISCCRRSAWPGKTSQSCTSSCLGGKLQSLHEEKLLAELVSEGAVVMVDNVPPEVVGSYMAAADFGINLVLPVDRTHILAQPRKLYEYLLAGLPVLGADVPTIRRVLEESQCGIAVDPESPIAIAAALVTLATDRVKRSNMGQNARIAANSRYTWAAQEKGFLLIFEKLGCGASSAAPQAT